MSNILVCVIASVTGLVQEHGHVIPCVYHQLHLFRLRASHVGACADLDLSCEHSRSELCQHHVDSFVGYNFGFARSFLTSLCDSGGGEICLVALAILDICQVICLLIEEAGIGLIHLEALGIRCGPQHSKSSCQN